MASAPLHLAVIAIVVLCLALNANAQNLTASIQPQNLTAYKQAVSNFSGSVREPSFPCGSGSSGLVGGYKELDLDSNENLNDVELLINDVYDFFLSATVNVTNCAAPYYPLINLTSACSQVVSGTNYGLEFTAYYYCFDSEGEVLTDTQAPLRSVVYVPIQDASLETADQAFDGPVIKDIWFFDTPEVIAYAEGPPEEEAPAPELAPEAEAPAAESGITLLSPGAGSLDSGTTSFTFSPSPAASSSPSARASPTPQVVSGFSVAAQNQSIISG